MRKELDIYKASAGSGKTYTLTEQYIKMLLDATEGGSDYFRHVLAVTFTNKATDEMKSRIVKKLYKISKEKEAVSIADTILEPAKAKELLTAILHNYSFFRITTIDKFFQQIIRSFVREIGLNGSYSIELDEKRVIKETISDILIEIGDNKHQLFRQWFADRMIEDSATGDSMGFSSLKNQLEEFSSQIFKEQYLELKSLIPDNATIRQVRENISKKRRGIIQNLTHKAESILDRIEESPFSITDCKPGSFTPLVKFVSKETKYPELTKTLTGWTEKAQVAAKSPLKPIIEAEYESWIRDMVTDFIDAANASLREFSTCNVILRNLPYLVLFKAIDAETDKHIKESNTQLLSKSGDFIKNIIDGSDTPFIYEKTGTYINHFLIDEFQDTSRLQWDNFIPLIKNSLSEGDRNLVVGDVKQSIYRFRDSDWSILGKEVENVFKGYCHTHTLDSNYRSLPCIVEFNNLIFTNIANYLQRTYNALAHRDDDHTITDAYADVRQIPQRDKGVGYVEINFESGEYDLILDKIKELQEHGYRLKDIGILVRRNSEGSDIAKYLLENGVNVVSEEALKISSNQAVSDIISILRYISSPTDPANNYLVNNFINSNGRLDISTIEHLPLYEIVEQSIFMLDLEKESANIPYLNAFKDLVTEYIGRQGSVITSFLEYWDEVKESRSLTTISESDSINIITIHKSKGLSYKVVIMPEINWKFHNNKKPSIIWERIPEDETDYARLGCVPLQYSAELADTIFSKRYYDELLLDYIDNLNDLYVAFTRAEDALIGYCSTTKSPFKETDTKAFSSIFPLLYAGTGRDMNTLDLSQLTSGELPERPLSQPQTEDVQTEQNSDDTAGCELSPVEKMRTFHLRSEDPILPEAETGSRMHRILEKVNTLADIDNILQDMLYKGHINSDEFEKFKRNLTLYISNPQATQWFDGSQLLLTERKIIDISQNSDGIACKTVKRPDRVMIDKRTGAVTIVDYKFGEERQKKHLNQVRDYMNLYKKAGHSNVTGYLYYFEGLEIVKV